MAWTKTEEGHFEPNGKPFKDPSDSFERAYNRALESDPESVEGPLEPYYGFPISTRSYKEKPRDAKQLRNWMDYYFDPSYQRTCMTAGNTPEELDLFAKRLLTYAVLLDAPVTDRERAIAQRLGIDVEANPPVVEGAGGVGY